MQGLGLGASGLRGQTLHFGVGSLGMRLSSVKLKVWGLGFRVWGLGLRAYLGQCRLYPPSSGLTEAYSTALLNRLLRVDVVGIDDLPP